MDGRQWQRHLWHQGWPLQAASMGTLHAEAGQALSARLRLAQGRTPRAWAEEPRDEGRILLADAAQKALPATTAPDGVRIKLPAEAPDKIASVVVLEIEGRVEVAPLRHDSGRPRER